MKKIIWIRSEKKALPWVCCITLSLSLSMFLLSACEKDMEQSVSVTIPSTPNIEPPTLDKYLTTTDTDGFSIRMRFTNGGDVPDNMKCTVYWKSYASKPSTTPSASSLSNVESMRVYASTSRSTTFDKSHAGYNGGTYIYYYAVCRNSKYSCTTPVTYTVVKR